MQVQNYYSRGSRFIVPTFSAGLFSLQIFHEGSGVPADADNSSRPAYYHWDKIKGTPPSPGVKRCAQGWCFSGLTCSGVIQIPRFGVDAQTRRREDALTRKCISPQVIASLGFLCPSGLVTRADKVLSSAPILPVSSWSYSLTPP